MKTRHNIFKNNQEIIKKLEQITGSVVEHLAIKPCIEGEADSQPNMPLVGGDTFRIDLSHFNLPEACGGGSFTDKIHELCEKAKIDCPTQIETAFFTPVMTAIPGQHASEDTEFKEATAADFVPVFKQKGRVFAFSYALNGETKLNRDHLVTMDTNGMTCLGRASNSLTAFKAVEISNKVGEALEQNDPTLFHKNASMVVFVEYDLIKSSQPLSIPYKLIRSAGLSSGRSFNGVSKPHRKFREYPQSSLRSDFDGILECSRLESLTLQSASISDFSIIGQGGAVQDHSMEYEEYGEKVLSRVHVYFVNAMVINTNGEELKSDAYQQIAERMKKRVVKLSQPYLEHQANYKYSDLSLDLNNYPRSRGITTGRTDLFEHTLLKIAGVTELPKSCLFFPEDSTSINVGFSLPETEVLTVARSLRHQLGDDFCLDACIKDNEYPDLHFIRVSVPGLQKNMAIIWNNMDEILAIPRQLLAYQYYSAENSPLYEEALEVLCQIADSALHGYDYRNEAMQQVLSATFLSMFHCLGGAQSVSIEPVDDYIGYMLNADIVIEDGSSLIMDQLLQSIAQRFPEFPIVAKSDNRIRIDAQMLCSTPFQQAFKQALLTLLEEVPSLIDEWKVALGIQRHSTQVYQDDLNDIAKEMNITSLKEVKGVEPSKQQENKKSLVNALLQFSSILSDPDCKRSDRINGVNLVRRGIAGFEAVQDAEDNQEFKEGNKRDIKEIISSLGLGLGY